MKEKVTINKTKPKVSIIMGIYNDFLYLEESIQSILKQTFKDFELIIVNDGSKANVGEKLDEMSKKDPRIKIISHKSNFGLAKSLNDAIEVAQGQYIARMDADDISLENRLEIQVKYLDKNKDVTMVGTSIERINKEGKILSKYTPPTDKEKIYKALETYNPMVHPSIMFRNLPNIQYREKFKAVQDYDLYLRMKDEGLVIKNINIPLIRYRIDEKHSDIKRVLKHISYRFLAIDFHNQRVEKGRDNYDSFNPDKYENLKIETISDTRVIKDFISSAYRVQDIKECREISKYYLREFGFDVKVFKTFLLTFLPRFMRNLLRSLSNYYNTY